MEAVELGNDDRPADAPRLSGVHDWKVGKLKLQRRRYQQSTACSLRRPAWVVCVWSCEGLRFPDPDTDEYAHPYADKGRRTAALASLCCTCDVDMTDICQRN